MESRWLSLGRHPVFDEVRGGPECSMIRVFNQYISTKSIIRVILECGAIAMALLCGTRMRFWNNTAGFEKYVTTPDFLAQAIAFVGVLQICFYYSDLYGVHMIHRRQDQAVLL